MKIEANKKYMDTTGAVTTAMHPLGNTGANIFFSCSVNGEIRCYTAEGKYLTEGNHKYDLVAEYKEETTMMPGDYYFDENNNMRSVHEDENGEEAPIKRCHAERVKDREIVGWTEEDYGQEYPVYKDEDDAGADRLPLLNIFKLIRTIHDKTPAKFLARADDGSYLFEVGGRYTVWRVDADDVDDQFENVPEETAAVVRMYKNAEGNKFFVWGSDARSQSALATCELTYSEEQGWRVRSLKGEEK